MDKEIGSHLGNMAPNKRAKTIATPPPPLTPIEYARQFITMDIDRQRYDSYAAYAEVFIKNGCGQRKLRAAMSMKRVADGAPYDVTDEFEVEFAGIWASATQAQKDAFKMECGPKFLDWIRADIRLQAFDSKHAMDQANNRSDKNWSVGVQRAHDRAAALFDADIEALVAAVE